MICYVSFISWQMNALQKEGLFQKLKGSITWCLSANQRSSQQ